VKTINLKQWLKLREYIEKHMLSYQIQQQYQQQQYQQQQHQHQHQHQQRHPMMMKHPYQQLQDVTMMDMGGGGNNNNNNSDCKMMDTSSSLFQFQFQSQLQLQRQFQSQSLSLLSSTAVTPTSAALLLNIVECPGSNDVIFRRGKSMNYHPGNVQFQNIIESRLDEFTKAKNQKGQQLKIVIEIIHYIQNIQNGIFLKWNASNGWWTIINNKSSNSIKNSSLSAAAAAAAINSSATINSDSDYEMKDNNMNNTNCNSSNNLNFTPEELEIQSKVHYAFRDFKKKIQTQQNLQFSKSSTYAFERQDGSHIRKRGRKINNSAGNNAVGCGGGGGGGGISFFCGANTPDSDNVVSDGD
jgi:hypothetical protein